MKNLILVFTLSFWFCGAMAQSDQSEYLEAKRLFGEKRYTSAKGAFGALKDSEVFGAYAQFYYGLCAYHQGDFQQAETSWEQLLQKHPKWEQKMEVVFWLAYGNMGNGEYLRGLRFASLLSEEFMDAEREKALVQQFLSPLAFEELKALHDQFPKSRPLAELVAVRMAGLPFEERDMAYIQYLATRWNFELNDLLMSDLPLVKKDTYNIAVLLPFLFESLDDTRVISQNRLVMDMYQGMTLAEEELAANGFPVSLYPYDTKRKKQVTSSILENESLKAADLIIGPLYSGPNEVVNIFSDTNKINTINPLSSNGEVIGDNPFSFLFKPSYQTLGRKLAEFAATENEDNKNVMIFYEGSARDSTLAGEYRKTIEEKGFKVLFFREITKENSRGLLDTLVAKYTDYLTKSEADSVSELPGRFVKDRRIRQDELEKKWANDEYDLPVSHDDDNNPIVYYQELFTIKPDSIGHILAATRSNLFANNLISAVETRGDSIKLYGYGDWLDFTMLSFQQLDRLKVAMGHPDYVDDERYGHEQLREKFIKKFKTNPSLNHFRGYELVWYTGQMLHTYGKYFQKGLSEGRFNAGRVFEGFKYGVHNDNQIVPVVRFNNAKLEVVNRDTYED